MKDVLPPAMQHVIKHTIVPKTRPLALLLKCLLKRAPPLRAISTGSKGTARMSRAKTKTKPSAARFLRVLLGFI